MELSGSNAAQKGVQNMLLKEACALGMEQRSNDAVEQGAQSKLRIEDCVLGMEQCGQRGNAILMDAQTMSLKEEFAKGTEQLLNYAVVMDAQIKFGKEGYAGDMVQRQRSNCEAVQNVEEHALGMGLSKSDETVKSDEGS